MTKKEVAVQRGLGTYLEGIDKDPTGRLTVLVPLNRIKGQITVSQARKQGKDLQAFVDSIRTEGLLQPVVLRKMGDNYELVAGRHRVLAHKLLGLEAVPAIVREDLSDGDVHVHAAIENLQRAAIDPWEEAITYQAALAADPKLTKKELAERVGVGQSTVGIRLKLASLGPKVGPKMAERHQRHIEEMAVWAAEEDLWPLIESKIDVHAWSVHGEAKAILANSKTHCLPLSHAFIEKHTGYTDWSARDWIASNPTYKKALKGLSVRDIKQGKQLIVTICLEPKAAVAAVKAAADRYKAKLGKEASKTKDELSLDELKPDSHVDRVRKLFVARGKQATIDRMMKHLPSQVSMPDTVERDALILDAGQNTAYIRAKRDIAACTELAKAICGDAYEKDLEPHSYTGLPDWGGVIERLWTEDKNKARALVVGLRAINGTMGTFSGNPGLPSEEICELATGTSVAKLQAKVTKQIRAEAKAKLEKKAKRSKA